ncbi:MAG: phosphotransferase family protein [Clostridiaceae bacterium]|jgi:thiamine kinase-like enzyme|nr:phosphotransferase family protein [Clostridiaceae bacterium]
MSEIVEADLSLINKLAEDVLDLTVDAGTIRSIRRLGGLTNRSYHLVFADGKELVVRIPGEGTAAMIDRKNEKISTELACELGIDAELIYFGEDGCKISNYIQDAVTMKAEDLRQPETIRQIAEVLAKIHNCGKDTAVPFKVFAMADQYENIIADLNVPLFEDYEQAKESVSKIKDWLDQTIKTSLQPCHNDPLCENWVMGKDKLYLVDWEYAGMNDGMWDLAAVSIEAEYDAECDRQLLAAYLGEDNQLEAMHFLASKIFVDYLWTLWAKARVPYGGQAMEDWAQERYSRLKKFLAEFADKASDFGLVL